MKIYETWLDEMEFKDTDDIVKLMVGLTAYHGGAFCIDPDIFMKKFPFLNNDENNIVSIIQKLRCNSIKFSKVRVLDTLDKLQDSYSTVYFIREY